MDDIEGSLSNAYVRTCLACAEPKLVPSSLRTCPAEQPVATGSETFNCESKIWGLVDDSSYL